jgi:AraC-like DNA-binding protein
MGRVKYAWTTVCYPLRKSAMRFEPFAASPALARHVELLWSLDDVPPYRREVVLPNGAVELIFNLGAPHKVVDRDDFARFRLFRRSWVAGMQRGPIVIEATAGSRLVGVRFRPGGARAILGMPLEELTDRVIETDDAWGSAFREVRDRLLETPPAAARVAAVQSMLERRLASSRVRPDPAVDFVVRGLVATAGQARIDRLRRRVGLDHSTIATRFRDRVGMSPRRLGRILRFQRAIAAANAATRPRWAEIAAETGYADQPHLIREFRELAGVTPTAYFASRDADENHMIMD